MMNRRRERTAANLPPAPAPTPGRRSPIRGIAARRAGTPTGPALYNQKY